MSGTERLEPLDVGRLYIDHNSWLCGWLRKRLNCSDTASDLAQDTFLRLLIRDQQTRLEEPRAFLTTVAKRVLSNHWRRERIETAYLESLANQPKPVELSLEERALLIESLMVIDHMLDGLPVIVRQAFFYAQLDGMKHADIAEELNISVSTVKRHLRRAALQCYFAVEAK